MRPIDTVLVLAGFFLGMTGLAIGIAGIVSNSPQIWVHIVHIVFAGGHVFKSGIHLFALHHPDKNHTDCLS